MQIHAIFNYLEPLLLHWQNSCNSELFVTFESFVRRSMRFLLICGRLAKDFGGASLTATAKLNQQNDN